MVWSEGGRGSRAHSPELVVAHVLVIPHVLVVTPVLTVAHVLVVACVRSWALAVIREPRWMFWPVVGRVGRGSWAIVNGTRHRRLCPSMGIGRHLWAVVAGCGRLWLGGGRLCVVVVVFVNKSKRERRGLPELISTVTTARVITVWTTWHVH